MKRANTKIPAAFFVCSSLANDCPPIATFCSHKNIYLLKCGCEIVQVTGRQHESPDGRGHTSFSSTILYSSSFP